MADSVGPRVVPLADLQRSPTAAIFEGGEIGISIFVVRYERGQGAGLHKHPYAETFVVEDGVAEFTVGNESLIVEAGNVVVVPQDTPHGFRGAGPGTLRVVSVHPSGEVQQTDL